MFDARSVESRSPWTRFHDIADEQGTTYAKITAAFRVKGCEAVGYNHSERSTEVDSVWGLDPATAASALYDLLGDDMDGAASILDDMF